MARQNKNRRKTTLPKTRPRRSSKTQGPQGELLMALALSPEPLSPNALTHLVQLRTRSISLHITKALLRSKELEDKVITSKTGYSIAPKVRHLWTQNALSQWSPLQLQMGYEIPPLKELNRLQSPGLLALGSPKTHINILRLVLYQGIEERVWRDLPLRRAVEVVVDGKDKQWFAKLLKLEVSPILNLYSDQTVGILLEKELIRCLSEFTLLPKAIESFLRRRMETTGRTTPASPLLDLWHAWRQIEANSISNPWSQWRTGKGKALSLDIPQANEDTWTQAPKALLWALASLQEGTNLEQLVILSSGHGPRSRLLRPLAAVARAIYQNEHPKPNHRPLSGSRLERLLTSLSRHWLGTACPKMAIDSFAEAAQKAGFAWLTKEIRGLELTPEEAANRGLILGAFQPLGSRWRRSLDSFSRLVEQEQGRREEDERLTWRLTYCPREQSITELSPYLQSRRGKSWSSGRKADLHLLKKKTWSPQDNRLLALTLGHGRSLRFPLERESLIRALIKHPQLYEQRDPQKKVLIEEAPPILSLQPTADEGLILTLYPEIPSERSFAFQEIAPHHIRCFFFNRFHMQFSKLAQGGLECPPEAREELIQLIENIPEWQALSTPLPLRRARIECLQSSLKPRIFVRRDGPRFLLEAMVRPQQSASPVPLGRGREKILTLVDGEPFWLERNFHAEHLALKRALAPVSEILPIESSSWLIDNVDLFLSFLEAIEETLLHGDLVIEWFEGETPIEVIHTPLDSLSLSAKSGQQWLELDGQLIQQDLDEEEILNLRQLLRRREASRGSFIMLDESRFLKLSAELRQLLDHLQASTQERASQVRAHKGLLPLLSENLPAEVLNLDPDSQSWLKAFQAGLASDPELPTDLNVELRPYQEDGVRWLLRLAQIGFGACLADDMGLGKTVQVLALLAARRHLGPSLVVAPTSVCGNWVREAKRFAPMLEFCSIYDSDDRQGLIAALGANQVLVTSYGLLHRETETLAQHNWSVVVLDEAQAIKNATAKRSKAARKLRAQMRVVVTGTPIENNLSELWTLFAFLNPGLLSTRKRFTLYFDKPIRQGDSRAKERLKRIIQPFILRRTKAEVLSALPERIERDIPLRLSSEEAQAYEAVRREAARLAEGLDLEQAQEARIQLLAGLMKLRRCCCHPKLVFPNYDGPASKIEAFLDLVEKAELGDHRILVFSQFVDVLDLVETAIQQQQVSYARLDGSTPQHSREAAVDAFQKGQGRIFLISLKAGGVGLNLTGADWVVHLDPWWNPAVEDQASDRVYRIGQDKEVTVFRLFFEGSIEEKILALHEEKRALSQELLDGAHKAAGLSLEKLLSLIQP